MTFAKYKVESYSFAEFRELDVLKELKKVDKLIGHLKRNKKAYMSLVLIVAIMFASGYLNPALAINPDEAIRRLDTLGNQLWKLVKSIGYWVVLLVTSRDCIKEAMRGSNHNIGGIITKGIIVMAVLYFLPELFSMMESIVG